MNIFLAVLCFITAYEIIIFIITLCLWRNDIMGFEESNLIKYWLKNSFLGLIWIFVILVIIMLIGTGIKLIIG